MDKYLQAAISASFLVILIAVLAGIRIQRECKRLEKEAFTAADYYKNGLLHLYLVSYSSDLRDHILVNVQPPKRKIFWKGISPACLFQLFIEITYTLTSSFDPEEIKNIGMEWIQNQLRKGMTIYEVHPTFSVVNSEHVLQGGIQ